MKKESKPASIDRANHQMRKPTRNPTPPTHKAFCRRCLAYNQGCPKTGPDRPTRSCAL